MPSRPCARTDATKSGSDTSNAGDPIQSELLLENFEANSYGLIPRLSSRCLAANQLLARPCQRQPSPYRSVPATVQAAINRGRLLHGNPGGDPSTAPRCGAKTRQGKKCRAPGIRNPRTGEYTRCRMHGGASTGPKTPEGIERCRKAGWKHGLRRRSPAGGTAVAGRSRRIVERPEWNHEPPERTILSR